MATNAPDSRQTHIVRLWGEDRNGNRIDDLWIDLERMDIVKSAMQLPPDNQWQGVQRKLRWCDDPTKEDFFPDGTPSRLIRYVKLCDPETQNVDDPDEFIRIPVIKGMKSRGGSGIGEGFMDRFINAVTNEQIQSAREFEVRRIVHHDTNIDAEAQAAIDADSSLKQFVVDSARYTRDVSSKDTSQYVEHEIATYIKHKTNSLAVQAMGRQTKLLNDYLINESENATQEIKGARGIDPPYRLDPFQNIINVNFGSVDQQWLVGNRTGGNINGFLEFPNAGDADIEGFDAEVADGGSWDDALCAASGLGFTVVSRGPVAFGTVKKADGGSQQCFLRAAMNAVGDASTVYRGTVVDGALGWEAVWTAPKGVQAVSYARDRFFVSYFVGDGPFSIRLAATEDASSFVTGINPFASVPSNPISGQDNIGGNVAYNKATKTFAIVGSHLTGTDENSNPSMCWGWSNDGIAWSSSFAADPYGQPGQNLDVKVTSLSAGNGAFVAAVSFKNRFPSPDTITHDGDGNEVIIHHDDYVLPQCGVAVSSNGVSWTARSLPGAVVRSSNEDGDRSGNSYAVAFIRDKESKGGSGINGYFVAAGLESGGIEGTQTTKLWKSGATAGTGWSLIRTETAAIFHGKAFIALSAVGKKLNTVVIV